MKTALATAALVGCALTFSAEPAAAGDTRACVSKDEYYGIKRDQSRAELEARWEVAEVASKPERHRFQFAVWYPVCDYSEQSGAVVYYGNDDHLWKFAQLVLEQDGTHNDVGEGHHS